MTARRFEVANDAVLGRGRRALGLAGAYLLGATTTWNLTNIGGAPELVAAHFAVGLAVVGLLTSVLFLAQTLLQIPGGRIVDRLGPRRVGLGCLVVVVTANLAIVQVTSFEAALALRFVVGLGGGIGFIAGIAYVRGLGGTALAHGLYGGASIAGAGLAVTVVAALSGHIDWEAPFVSAAVVNAIGLALLLLCPDPVRADGGGGRPGVVRSVLRDARVWRLASLQAATFGLSIVLGNWIVVLLTRHGGHTHRTAGVVGGLVLLGGVIGRPAGGWFAAARPTLRRPLAYASLGTTAVATLVLLVPRPLVVAVLAASLFGLASGVPFGSVFDAVTRVRPDAPGLAAAVMNAPTMATIMLGAPLFGATFGLPGEGRIGLVVLVLLMLAVMLAVPDRDALAPEHR